MGDQAESRPKKAIGYEHERGGSSRCGEGLMLRELNRP